MVMSTLFSSSLLHRVLSWVDIHIITAATNPMAIEAVCDVMEVTEL